MLYECRITIDPVYDEYERNKLRELLLRSGFKLANLYKKDDEISKSQSFLTGHDKEQEPLSTRMRSVCDLLNDLGHPVRRYQIQHILVDSKKEDRYNLVP